MGIFSTRKAVIRQLEQTIKKLEAEKEAAIHFIGVINTTNTNHAFKPGDKLGAALIAMQSNLFEIAREENKRRWIIEGVARFGDIFRKNNDNVAKLCDVVISELIKHLKVNQGAIYLVEDHDPKDIHIGLASCYAYNRKKHVGQRIEIGEGLIGQVYLERQLMLLKEVPKDYIRITSGLGEALPRSVLICPLLFNESVFGILELASFQMYEEHQLHFINKICESIASTIFNVKTAERTSRLLEESRQQAVLLINQEEEMRQNLEELTATQEAQMRLEKELVIKIEELEGSKLEIQKIREEEAKKLKQRNEVQVKVMNSTVEKFKRKESDLLNKIEQQQERINELVHASNSILIQQ